MTRSLLVAAALLLLVCAVHANTSDTASQTFGLAVNEVAKISVLPAAVGTPDTPGPGIPAFSLAIIDPAIGGDVPLHASNNATYLRWTSIVADVNKLVPTADSRKISVTRTAGVFPGGCYVNVAAAAPVGATGQAFLGTAGGDITGGSVNIVSGIMNGYTGIGATSGSQITWDLVVDPSRIDQLKVATASNITVTYTLSNAGF
jgi:hypothetical protein